MIFRAFFPIMHDTLQRLAINRLLELEKEAMNVLSIQHTNYNISIIYEKLAYCSHYAPRKEAISIEYSGNVYVIFMHIEAAWSLLNGIHNDKLFDLCLSSAYREIITAKEIVAVVRTKNKLSAFYKKRNAEGGKKANIENISIKKDFSLWYKENYFRFNVKEACAESTKYFCIKESTAKRWIQELRREMGLTREKAAT